MVLLQVFLFYAKHLNLTISYQIIKELEYMKKILVLLLLGILVFSDLGTVAFSFDKIKFDESNLGTVLI